MYFTMGYAFHTFSRGQHRATSNYGVCVRGETDFYGILKEIIEVEYPGVVNLKTTLFKCDWFDPVVGRGVRATKFGVVDVNESRQYRKFEPFILACQAEQVTFIPYPRVRTSGISWLSVLKIQPRGSFTSEDTPLQAEVVDIVTLPTQDTDTVLLVDPEIREIEEIPDESEAEDNETDVVDDDSDNTDDLEDDVYDYGVD